MGWLEFCRQHLPEHLDAHGDLAPPWARFPTYERLAIGWRMGAGETWLGYWRVFLDGLAADRATRLAYLRRHPAAPYSWSEAVDRVLDPHRAADGDEDEDGDDDDDGTGARARQDARKATLIALGLVAPDVAYATWLAQQATITWPWTYADTPADAARYRTRELWFWSRQAAAARDHGALPAFAEVPPAWAACAAVARAGVAGPIEPTAGLASLALVLAAGSVLAPWQVGLTPADFADSFDDDMGYVDAFRLWGMSAFDDAPTRAAYLARTDAPTSWGAWLDAQFARP